MVYTLSRTGGIGLSASQVGVRKNVFIAYENSKADEEVQNIYVIINSNIKALTGGRKQKKERCLSFPENKSIRIKRYAGVIINYTDETGTKHNNVKFKNNRSVP